MQQFNTTPDIQKCVSDLRPKLKTTHDIIVEQNLKKTAKKFRRRNTIKLRQKRFLT